MFLQYRLSNLLVCQADFQNMILSKIPPSKVHMSKKITSVQQNTDSVTTHCPDDSTYHGNILVGADDAYSAIRKSLYKELDDEGLLLNENKEEMPTVLLSMVGTTKSLESGSCKVLGVEGRPPLFLHHLDQGQAYLSTLMLFRCRPQSHFLDLGPSLMIYIDFLNDALVGHNYSS